MGVVAETGATHPRLTEDNLRHIGAGLRPRCSPAPQRSRALARRWHGRRSDGSDADRLGGAVCRRTPIQRFKRGAEAAARLAQEPGERREAVQGLRRDRGRPPRSRRPGSWAATKGVSLAAPVGPRRGVPYYLLIVGSPQRIPFEFQAQFDLQWAVGRLHFDKVEDYAAYAQKVVEYEKGVGAGAASAAPRVWMPRNPGDLATPLLAGAVGTDFLGAGRRRRRSASVRSFEVHVVHRRRPGDQGAAHRHLPRHHRRRRRRRSSSPARTAPSGRSPIRPIQQQRQGALVTQEWSARPAAPARTLLRRRGPPRRRRRARHDGVRLRLLRRRLPGEGLVFLRHRRLADSAGARAASSPACRRRCSRAARSR